MRGLVTALAAFATLVSCWTPPSKSPSKSPQGIAHGTSLVPRLVAVDYGEIPGWLEDDHAQALAALRRSCDVFALKRDNAVLGTALVPMIARHWRQLCAELPRLTDDDDTTVRAFLERSFKPFRVFVGSRADGLFTGYYEPLLNGARRRGGKYTVPIYNRPPELVTVDLGRFRKDLARKRIAGVVRDGRLDPFAARARIDDGVLAGRGLELVWVDDAADAFFLHIQGSGRIRLADGSEMRIGYAGANGHPYTAIGRILIKRGDIERKHMSMQAIRGWLASHPDQAQALMAKNASFIFFREIAGEGPIGSQGVSLTPGRSLAVDPAFVPMGLPVWLDVTDPIDTDTPLRRLMVAQDTGGAIKGAVRGDVFWGHGIDAAKRAGAMKSKGTFYLLIPHTTLQFPSS